jgi:hypothetical protein
LNEGKEDDLSSHSTNQDGDEDLPAPSEPDDNPCGLEQEPSTIPSVKDFEDLSSGIRKTREEDRKKGKAVSRQIVRILQVHPMLHPTFIVSSGFLGLAP